MKMMDKEIHQKNKKSCGGWGWSDSRPKKRWTEGVKKVRLAEALDSSEEWKVKEREQKLESDCDSWRGKMRPREDARQSLKHEAVSKGAVEIT